MPLRSFAVAGCMLATVAVAQVEVLEPGGRTTSPLYEPTPADTTAAPAYAPARQSTARPGNSGEFFNQLQALQEELMQLRGIVEEQGEQLRQLKQQRLDDYISLDKRLGAIGGGALPPPGGASSSQPIDASGSPTPPVLPQQAAVTQRPIATQPTQEEEQAYQGAYELVRAQNFAEAREAFKGFVEEYPSGAYTGNAHFWLGELYLVDGDSASARKHYEALITEFPDNRKVPDGMFKLGRIYDQAGEKAKAREILQRVVSEYANSDSSAPRLASEYLQENF